MDIKGGPNFDSLYNKLKVFCCCWFYFSDPSVVVLTFQLRQKVVVLVKLAYTIQRLKKYNLKLFLSWSTKMKMDIFLDFSFFFRGGGRGETQLLWGGHITLGVLLQGKTLNPITSLSTFNCILMARFWDKASPKFAQREQTIASYCVAVMVQYNVTTDVTWKFCPLTWRFNLSCWTSFECLRHINLSMQQFNYWNESRQSLHGLLEASRSFFCRIPMLASINFVLLSLYSMCISNCRLTQFISAML